MLLSRLISGWSLIECLQYKYIYIYIYIIWERLLALLTGSLDAIYLIYK